MNASTGPRHSAATRVRRSGADRHSGVGPLRLVWGQGAPSPRPDPVRDRLHNHRRDCRGGHQPRVHHRLQKSEDRDDSRPCGLSTLSRRGMTRFGRHRAEGSSSAGRVKPISLRPSRARLRSAVDNYRIPHQYGGRGAPFRTLYMRPLDGTPTSRRRHRQLFLLWIGERRAHPRRAAGHPS